MAKRVDEAEMMSLENIVRNASNGIGIQQIEAALEGQTPRRTVQYRLKMLVNSGRITPVGEGRQTKYVASTNATPLDETFPLSTEARRVQQYVRKPVHTRKPVGYNPEFLNSYRPNQTFYLSSDERDLLRQIGAPKIAAQPAGTYAKHILNRLLIDLSWNSSRLEGNTYSLLDTKRLLAFGLEANDKDRAEAQMILNHKDAIEFLVDSADDIGFNRYTILNIHAFLANNLLPDSQSPGRLRSIVFGIDGSAFHPLEMPQLIEEYFDQILATAAAINDPIEQSFFAMVHLPYLQPFDDVNKRVSRLAANIPLIKANLVPLSFDGVSRRIYTDGILGVYEANRVELLRDVYMNAYKRSADRYVAVRQSLGDPDPFRMHYRAELREVIGEIIRDQMGRRSAFEYIVNWAANRVDEADQERFHEIVEDELLGIHEGNFARFQIRPSEFSAWQHVWRRSASNDAEQALEANEPKGYEPPAPGGM